ncbi:MAG: hypothetical protein NVS4B8_15220 [Herpetosiphon sp.]
MLHDGFQVPRFITRLPRWLMEWATILGTMVLTSYLLDHTLQGPSHDFALIFWDVGQQILRHQPVPLSYPYPLWTPVLALPWTVWPFETAAMAWLACNFLMISGGVVLLSHLLRWRLHPLLLIGLAVLLTRFDPISETLLFGQNISVSFLLLMLIAYALQRQRPVLLGVALALLLIKPQVLILVIGCVFIWSILKRQWSTVISFTATVLVLISLALPFAQTPRQILGGGIGEHFERYLRRGSTIWGLCLTIGLPLWVPALIALLLVIALAVVWIRAVLQPHGAEQLPWLLGLTTIVNLLVSPYGWDYNYLLMLYPVGYAITTVLRLSIRWKLVWLSALFFALFLVPRIVRATLNVLYDTDGCQAIPVLVLLAMVVLIHWQVTRRPRRPTPAHALVTC